VSEEPVADRRIHPATIALRFIREAPQTLLALPAGVAVLSKGNLTRALIVAAVAGAIFLFFNFLAWSRFRYGVGAREIVIESGILHRNRRIIPFDRIQDVDIERALLARVFGLAKVKIETGAGGKDEGVIDSVSMAEAGRLREAVRAWREAQGGDSAAADGAAAQAPAPEGRLLFSMDMPRLLRFGLFNFSLVYLAALFALLQTFDGWLPFDIYDPGRWIGIVEERLPQRFTIGAIAAVLFVAVLLGVVAGVVRTIAADYRYRLALEGDRFRRERGLFTRSEAVIARTRVQLAHVGTGPVRQALGWAGLSFQTLGAGSGGSGLQPAAPFARREEIEPILAEAGAFRLPPPPELQMVSRRHVLRGLGVNVLPLVVGVGIAGLFFRPALLLLALAPPLALAAALGRRFHRYALDGDLLFVATGIWRRQLWIVPVASAQALSVARGIVQRRLGLATLSIDTAGAAIINAPRIVDLRLETARELAAEIAERRRAYSSGRKSGTDK
jgi:putative membrane protein